MDQPKNDCILCRTNEWTLFRDFGTYQLLRCKKCSLTVLLPQPSEEALQELYGAEYFTLNLPSQLTSDENAIEREIINRAYFLEWLGLNIKHTKGKLLEVGCASGFLLKAFERSGWNVMGIEISQSASSYARERLGLNVKTGIISAENLGNEIFDVIVMLNTLEHIQDPLLSLQLIRQHLSEDGYVIIQVPNIASLDALIQGRSWDGWSIPYHLFHYSPKTLGRLLERSGFKKYQQEFSLPPFEKRFLEWLKGKQSSDKPLHQQDNVKRGRVFRLRKSLLHLNKKLPLGRDITIIATKA